MDMQFFMDLMMHYGGIAIFVIVLLEYLNLPGFPAGVIMPLAGIWAASGGMNFFLAILITVAAGLTGSIALYGLGRLGGDFFLKKYYKKFPKHKDVVETKIQYLREKGSVGIIVSKLIPMVRTLISIPAGVMKMNFVNYVVSSAIGVFLWNLVFVGAGYVLGDAAFTILA